MDVEARFVATSDELIEAARHAFEGLSLVQVHAVQVYGRLMARQAVERAAVAQHRAGRHTLAQQVLDA